MKDANKNNGFSLIELMLYVSISSIILLSIASFVRTVFIFSGRSEAIIEVEHQGQNISNLISQKIVSSEGIILPVAESSDNILYISDYDNQQSPTVFNILDGSIFIEEDGGSSVILNNNKVVISDLVFHNVSLLDTPGLISFSFRIAYNNQDNRPEYNYSKTFYGSSSLR